MDRSLGTRILVIVVGLAALGFGIFTGYSHGWQLDIVSTLTIVAGVVLVLLGTFAKTTDRLRKSVHSRHL